MVELRRIQVLAVLLLVGALSCSSRNGEGPVVDAGPDSDDGHAGESDEGRDSPVRIGSSQTLEVATWNIKNFPTDGLTASRVAELVREMDLDFVAVQEIADQDRFSEMLDTMEGYRGVLSPHEYSPGEYQKVGFLYRKELFSYQGSVLLFEDDSYAFPRPAFRADFGVWRGGEMAMSVSVIVVHLKANTGEENEARRRAGIEKLKEYVDLLVENGTETEVILLGDFNDELTDPPEDNVFTVFLDDNAGYRMLTAELAEAGAYSLLPWNRLVDHIAITGELMDEFQDATTVVVPLDTAIHEYDYVESVSDHLPVATLTSW
jgi:endonuclease/exonuclease/phosphatase family metal-dependent hydrolase